MTPTEADENLLEQFAHASIDQSQWTHETHVRVAYLNLCIHGLEDSINILRAGIPKLNEALGIENTDDGGYHDTLTVGWLHVMHFLIQAHTDMESFDNFYQFHGCLHNKRLLVLYYSRPCINSVKARRQFVEPDLAPFPVPPVHS